MKHLKKIAVLFLILTFFYNVLGLYTVFADQQEQTWITAMEKVDESKFEIFEFEIDPYAYIVDSGFEEVNEDVVINHTVYHVFKNRIQNNILKLYCLKNTHQDAVNKDLRNVLADLLVDNSNKDNPTKKALKSFVKDYISLDVAIYELHSQIIYNTVSFSFFLKNDLLDGFFTTHYPPPNVA